MTSTNEKRVAPLLRSSSSSSDEWYTPIELIRALGKFDLDPACGPLCKSRTAARRYGPRQDGLSREWKGRVWLNPPFSGARPWIEKLSAHGNGVALVFCRSDALWFQNAVASAGGCYLLTGRTQFSRPSGPTSKCPLGCVLLPFGARNRRAVLQSGIRGVWLRYAEIEKGQSRAG